MRLRGFCYRAAVGPNAGQKALTLKLAALSTATVTKAFTVERDGFSLPLSEEGSVAFKAHQRERIDGLCRYFTGPRADGRRSN